MNKFLLVMRVLAAGKEKNNRAIGIAVLLTILFLPIFIVMLIAVSLSMPVDWLRKFLLLDIPNEELYIIQQIRPDLIQSDQTIVDGHDYGMPINRTIRHYFGDNSGEKTLDYLTYNCNGDNLYAIADGEVVDVDSSEALGGWYIIIEHDAPEDDEANWYLYSKYWAVDIDSEHVEVGDHVDQGDVIAQAMSSKNSNSTMIFCFQMYGDSDYEPIDPLPYIGEEQFDEEITIKPEANITVVEGVTN